VGQVSSFPGPPNDRPEFVSPPPPPPPAPPPNYRPAGYPPQPPPAFGTAIGYGGYPPPPVYGVTIGPGGVPINTAQFESRATTVLTLGIISLVVLFICGVFTPILGPAAIITGLKLRKDTKAAGVPEPSRSKTGWILGIISTSLFGLFIAVIVLANIGARRSSTSTFGADDPPVTVPKFPTSSPNTAKPGTPPSSISEFPPVTAAGRTLSAPTPCPKADGSETRVSTFAAPPPMCIDATKTYSAVVTTNKGALSITLYPELAPETVNNFVVLARYHFFDNTTCHRIIPGFVVQCGDPTGTGAGGPGYTFADELPEDGMYVIGSVAMANSGPDTNTNGSQFFIMTGDHGASLPPKYSLFGEVDFDQDDVMADLDAAGSLRGTPTKEAVYIESVEIFEN
jgi:cyclophilin family peptidyl-prolyl cis-trans isomerase